MTNPNEQAFPFNGEFTAVKGLTKREYFSALALQAYIGRQDMGDFVTAEKVALAVDVADKLIAELNKNG